MARIRSGKKSRLGTKCPSAASRWKESAQGERRRTAASRLARSADQRDTSIRSRSSGSSDQPRPCSAEQLLPRRFVQQPERSRVRAPSIEEVARRAGVPRRRTKQLVALAAEMTERAFRGVERQAECS